MVADSRDPERQLSGIPGGGREDRFGAGGGKERAARMGFASCGRGASAGDPPGGDGGEKTEENYQSPLRRTGSTHGIPGGSGSGAEAGRDIRAGAAAPKVKFSGKYLKIKFEPPKSWKYCFSEVLNYEQT